MSELEARLSTLLTGAQQLQTSSDRLRLSIDNSNRVVDELLYVSDHSTGALILLEDYQAKRATMTAIPDTLRQLSESLQSAHDDIAAAVVADGETAEVVAGVEVVSLVTASAAAGVFHAYRRGRRHANRSTPTVITTAATLGTAWAMSTPFVAGVNRTLYEDWSASKHRIETSTELRETLSQERDQKQRELNALTNRILTFTPDANLDRIDRVQGLRSDISDLGGQITQLDAQIAHTRETFVVLDDRMQRVMPGAGAMPDLLVKMETGKTAQIVLDNTQDCVHFVASRVTIPPNMATNAYLWNDNVAKLGDYGIKSGTVPLAGAVLVMEREHPYANDVYGHVMYVEQVDARGVWVTDNLHPEKPILLSDLTSETSGANISYVYFPWNTRG